MIPRKTIKKFIASLSLPAFSSRRLSITGRPAWRVAVAVAALTVLAGGPPAQASEYSVKARFLVNFALYTYWPGTAFVDERSPVNICLYGRDPFGAVLDEAAGARQYVAGGGRSRSLNVWRIETVAELTDCHVVFVSGVKVDEQLIDRIAAPYRLIVGESGALTRSGGHIRIYQGEEGMAFEVNLDAVKRAELHLSSQLLRLASGVGRAAEARR